MIIHTPRFVYRAVLTLVSIMVFAWMPVMGQLQIVDESGSIFCHVGSTAITVAASGVTELCSDNSSSATPADIYNFTGSEVFSGASTESISAPGAENLPLSGLSEVQTQLSLNKAGLPTNSFLQGINRINFGLILLAFLALSLFYLFLRSTIWKPRFLIATLMALMFAINSNAQNSVSYTTSDTWTCPAGVTSITVECWGGGGRGGAMDATGTHGVGGGGGGAYAKGQVTVVPGNSYTVNVGNGSTTDVAGGDSWFQNSSTVMAKGGNSVPTNQTTGASGGLATASVGTTAKWSGGAGADGTNSGTYYSGGGGGGAGSTGVGGDASGSTGGTGTTIGGGNGANGISSNGNGVAGNTYSGGGSGGRKGTGTVTRVGGAGANGQVIVTWTLAGYCSGNALSVYSQTNVNNDNRATGVPNNSGAELYETNDQLALELTDGSNLLTAGGSVDVIWERTSNNNTSILVEISTDGTNWTFVNDYTDINPQNNWLTQSIPLSINTRYIRFTSNNGWDLAIDAVTFNTPCAPPGPSLNVTPASLDFGSVVSGGTSTNQTYVLSGTNLTGYPGNITVTAPTNFEVSLTSGSGFGSSVSVPYSSATLANRTIYVRFKPTAVNTTSTGNISNAGGGATTQNVAVTGNSNLNYCGFTFGNVRPITKVVFSTLTNSSSELTSSAATEDFTSLTSNVTAGQNYTLTVQCYTNGNNTYNYIAFFDWNQDGDFVDTGESFNIGTITNSTGLDGKSASTTITVPSGATLGNTRFRIISHYNSYNTTPCSVVDGNSYGQIEDYTLNIIPNISISTSAISPTSYCAGASVSVPYTKSGTFNSGNIFTAQLSNASGSFASPVNIGTLTSTSAGTISGTIPAGTIYGIGYRIRVVSSTPATIGTDNGSNLTVNPIPIATANPASQTICSGTAPSIALSSNVSGTTFAWTVVESGVSGASASSGATIAQTLTATGTTAGTATYTITPTANGCAGTPEPVVITVNPMPVATATPTTQTICSGTAPSIVLTSNVSGTTFAWTVVESGVSGATASSGSTIAQTLTATGTTAGTATYTITPTANGCAGTPLTVVITVNPIPDVTATLGSQTICSGTATSIALTSNVSGANFVWMVTQSGVSGASIGSGSNITQTLTATGSIAGTATYTIAPLANGCSGSSIPVIITVDPNPVATATPASKTICSGTAPSIALSSNVSGTTFAWTVVESGVSGATASSGSTIAQTLTATGTTAGTATYTITPTANGCAGSPITVVVTVNPIPIVTATPASQTICSVTAPSIALTSNVSGTTFAWTVVQSGVSGATTSSGSTIAQTLTATGTTAGTATYSITPTASGCAGTPETVVITVDPIPVTNTTPGSQTICSGTAPSIALTSNVSGTTFAWTVVQSGVSGATFASGSAIAQNLAATGTTAGTATYTITPTANGCMGATKIAVITVNPIPVATTTPASQTISSGTAPSIALTSNVSGTTFSWTVAESDVSGATSATGSIISQTLTATVTTTGTATYTITPTANGCSGATKIVVITVNPTPIATATPASETICSGTAPSIALTSNLTGTTYTWTVVQAGVSGATASSGETIAQTLTTTGISAGTATYTITPFANSFAGTPIIVVITVNPIPVATATPAAQSICSGTAPSIALTSNVSGTTFAWTVIESDVSGATASSGSTIDQILTATATTSGTATYNITPTANGCAGATKVVLITVKPTPVATATPASQSICSGTASSISLTSNFIGTTFAWTVIQAGVTGAIAGSGSIIAQTLFATGTIAGTATYTITPTANGCAGIPVTVVITVKPTPVATASPASQTICSGTAPSIALTSNVTGTSFAWTATQSGVSGASVSSGETIVQTLTATGVTNGTATYSITPNASGCAGAIKTVVITIRPTPVVIVTPAFQTICSGTTTSIALSSSVGGTTFAWTIAVDPSGSITGASNGSANSIAQTLSNSTLLQANVTYSITPIANSCSGIPLTATVTVNPAATLSSSLSASVCSNMAFSYNPTSNTPLTTFSWTRAAVLGIQNGTASGTGDVNETLVNTTGVPQTVIYVYMLTANGCITTQNVSVTVNPSPILSSSLSPSSVCSNTPFIYNAFSSVTGTTITWTRAVIADISNPAGAGSGNINETLINTSAANVVVPYVYTLSVGGCTSNFTVNATIKPTPNVIVPANLEYCNGNNVPAIVFTGNVAGTNYTWGNNNTNIGLAATGTGNIPAFTAANSTSSLITASISVWPTANSCIGANSTFNISVYPTSQGGTVNSNASVCGGANSGTLILSGQSGSVTKWQYSTDGGTNWIDINNTTTSHSYTNLTLTTQYRAIVQSGVCLPATSSIATITINQPSVGGTVTADASVCYGTNNGTLTLSGHTGSIIGWQSSINGGASWSVISNSTNQQLYTNLTITTQYRAIVQNGVCATANSTSAIITVNPTSAGGSVSGGTTICSGSSSGLLTLSGQVGTVTKWQYSVSPFSSWSDIANTATSYTSGVLTQTTQFRAVVASGICGSANSATTTVTVNPISVGGSVAGGTTVCSGSTSGLLTLSGYIGTINKWQYSVSPFSIWTDISNTATSYTSGVLTQTTQFRAVISSGFCSSANSAAATVTVDPTASGGSVTGGTNICYGSTSGLLTLSGQVGTVTKWQYSVSPFSSWTDIANSTTSYTSGALTQTTQFRAVVTSGICSSAISAATTVTVDPTSTGGSVAGGTTICSGSTSGLLTLSGQTGTVTKWQYSVSPFSSWTDIANTSTTFTSGALTQNTQFRAVVKSGVCSLANSTATTVTVSPSSVGGSVSGGTTICSGSNSSALTLSGYTGTITKWQSSTVSNFSSSVTDIANTTNNLTATNLNTTTYYRAVIQNGSCSVSYSTAATVTVKPTPSLSSSLTPTGVCSNVVFTYLPTSSTPGTTFNWTRAVVIGITNPANSGTGNPDEYLLNTTNSPIAVTYAYSLSANGCTNVQNVVVIVTPTPHLTSTTSPTPICGGTTFSYVPTSDVVGTIFPWTRAAALGNPSASGTGNPNEVLINNTATTASVTYIYTLQSNDCSNPVTYPVTVTIIPAPIVTVSASSTTICPGGNIDLFSSSNITSSNPPTLLTESFNSAATGATTGPNGWTTTNASLNGTTANAAWTVRADGYTYSSNDYHSNDNSKFYFSNSDAQSGTSTLTTLVSPKINTNNYTSLTLDFYDYYNDRGASDGDYAYIDISTNDGASWTVLSSPDYNNNTDHGGRTSFAHQIINLGAYIGFPDFRFRFRYVATDDRYWAIDNITLSGTPSATATIAWTSNTSSWTSAVANPTGVTPPSTTTYTATYTDPISNCSGSNSVVVTVLPTPTPTITSDYCTYRSIGKVRLTSSTCASCTYLWNTGATTSYIDVDLAGIYTVTVTNASGCSGSSSIAVAQELVVNGDFSAGNSGFTSDYAFKLDQPGLVPAGQGELYDDSGINGYSIVNNGQNVHINFWGIDHTQNATGNKNFMIVNGHGTLVVWKETVTVQPNTDYYFAAWAMSVNNAGNYAQLRFAVNGVPVGTTATLGAGPSTIAQANANTYWTRFYSNPKWNSGALSGPVTLSIIDLNSALGGNDFGIDDISFGTLASVPFSVTAASNSPAASPICSRGTLNLTSAITGGSAPIVYSWTGPNSFTSGLANPVIPNITHDAGGLYTVSVLDAYNCPGTFATTTVVLSPTPEIPNYSIPICSGTSFNATPVNGVPDAGTFVPANTAYTWAAPIVTGGLTGGAAGTGLASITGTFTNPTTTTQTATYTITPFTWTGTPATPLCTGTPFTIVVTVYPKLTVSAGANRSVCADAPSVTLSGTFGGGATSAAWTGGTGTFNPNRNTVNAIYTPSASEITAGTVALTLTTNTPPTGPCGAVSATMTITIGVLPVLSTVVTQVKCFGDATGAINLTVTGGGASPTYIWKRSNGTTVATTEDLSGLVADTYTVVVTATNGCTATKSVIITQPTAALSASAVVTGMLCAGGATGTITLSVSGGTPIYTYSWTASGGGVIPSGQAASKDLTGLVSGTYAVTVMDDNNCTVSLSKTVTVAANTAPVITTCPVTRNLNGCSTAIITGPVFSASITGSTYSEFSNSPNNGVATDNCAITTVSYQDVATSACPIIIARTWTLGDASGLTSTCTQTITVSDIVAPTWTTAAAFLNRSVECSDAAGLIAALALFPTASDACDADVSNIVKTTGSFVPSSGCSQEGSYTNTWKVTDECGNVSIAYTQVITITDNTAPLWTTLSGTLNRTVECSDVSGLAAAQALVPVASDNCDANVTDVIKVAGAFVAGGICSNSGTYTNTWTVTDDCGNTSSIFTQLITITDNTAPVWISAPGDINRTLECNDASGLAATQALYPVASDNCTADVSNINKTTGVFVPSGVCAQQGTYTNTWTVTDGCGNTSNVYNQVITIVDNTGPIIICPASNAFPCDLPSLTPAVTGTATVVDNCDANPTLTWADVIVPGGCAGNYKIIRTWTATDNCGNSNTCPQTIFVQDVTPPVITCAVSGNQNVFPDPPADYIVPGNAWDATATDKCSAVTLTASLTGATISGPFASLVGVAFKEGVTTVTWTATDGCGISSGCQFTVTVIFRPVISCPSGISVNTEPDVCTATLNAGFPTLISGTPNIVYTWIMTGATMGSGTGPIGNYTFNGGITTITWTATNIAGTGECSQTITVIDNQIPSFSIPADKNYCVREITSANYYDPTIDITPVRPDYYLFEPGNTELDLDPATFSDNCSSGSDIEIHWRIDFATTNPPPAVPSITGTGQLSTYGSPIMFLGDAANLVDASHIITYWITDKSGNESTHKATTLIVKPRPNVIKQN